MYEFLVQTLTDWGVKQAWLESSSIGLGTAIIIIVAFLGRYIAKHQILAALSKAVEKSSNKLDDLLLSNRVFDSIMSLVPSVMVLFLTPHLLPKEHLVSHILLMAARVAICFQVANIFSAGLDVFKSIYRQTAREKYIPLNSAIQVMKLVIYIVAIILAVSYVIDRSPIYLLSGLGALTAVLLLVFQDTIKGLVASIQISANRMVAPGDWIEMPKYGADGDVLEIGLNTVKVQNFDKTITTVPTYALISHSFKNWRDMFHSGGRRIKRALLVDIASIKFYQPEEIEKIKSISLLKDYLADKEQDIKQWNQNQGFTDTDTNARQLTNVGTFRAYIEAYLAAHPKVHPQMTRMVRQLAPTEHGMPLELYFFSSDQNWVNYENIQADVFDHIFAMAKVFDIRIFQQPTGFDWQSRN